MFQRFKPVDLLIPIKYIMVTRPSYERQTPTNGNIGISRIDLQNVFSYGVRRINNKFGYFNDEFLYKIFICARVVLVLIDCDWWCFMLGVQTPPLGADAWAIFALVSFKFSKAFR